MNGRDEPLAVINGLRGWAILGVLYHHSLAIFLTRAGFSSTDVGGYWLSPWALLSNGWLGVNLFFVLSGFVLMLPYARGTRTLTSWADTPDFYLRRARRLFPLYYLVIGLAMFMRPQNPFGSADFLAQGLKYLTFTFVYDERLFFTWYNPVLWSLAVEVWFSVVFPALVVFQQRFGMRWLVVLVVPLCLLVRLYGTAVHPESTQPLNPIKDNLPGRLDDFVAGMALAAWSTRSAERSVAKAVAAFAVACALLTVAANAWDDIALLRLGSLWGALLNDVELLAFAALIYAALVCPSPALALPFTARPIQLLGMMSYSIYMWHVMGGSVPGQGLETIPMYFVMVFGIAALSYRYIEFPQRSFRDLFLRFPRLPLPAS